MEAGAEGCANTCVQKASIDARLYSKCISAARRAFPVVAAARAERVWVARPRRQCFLSAVVGPDSVPSEAQSELGLGHCGTHWLDSVFFAMLSFCKIKKEK